MIIMRYYSNSNFNSPVPTFSFCLYNTTTLQDYTGVDIQYSSESTCPLPYLPSELLYGFVDIPAVLFILLLSHISKQRLQRGDGSHPS